MTNVLVEKLFWSGIDFVLVGNDEDEERGPIATGSAGLKNVLPVLLRVDAELDVLLSLGTIIVFLLPKITFIPAIALDELLPKDPIPPNT